MNEMFRFVSLRGPEEHLTIPVDEGVGKGQLAKAVSKLAPSPSNPGENIKEYLSTQPVKEYLSSVQNLSTYFISKIWSLLREQYFIARYFSDQEIPINENGSQKATIKEVIKLPDYINQIEALVDLWVAIRLTENYHRSNPNSDWVYVELPLLSNVEDLLRADRIVRWNVNSPNRLQIPGVVEEMHRARIVFPEDWQPGRRLREANIKKQIEFEKEGVPTSHEKPIEKAKRQALSLRAKRMELESIEKKMTEIIKFKQKLNQDEFNSKLLPPVNRRSEGLIQKIGSYFFGKSLKAPKSRVPKGLEVKPVLYKDISAELDSRLTKGELKILEEMSQTEEPEEIIEKQLI